jgi:hypothetical protein
LKVGDRRFRSHAVAHGVAGAVRGDGETFAFIRLQGLRPSHLRRGRHEHAHEHRSNIKLHDCPRIATRVLRH